MALERSSKAFRDLCLNRSHRANYQGWKHVPSLAVAHCEAELGGAALSCQNLGTSALFIWKVCQLNHGVYKQTCTTIRAMWNKSNISFLCYSSNLSFFFANDQLVSV